MTKQKLYGTTCYLVGRRIEVLSEHQGWTDRAVQVIEAHQTILGALEAVYEYNKHFVCAPGPESDLLDLMEKAIAKGQGGDS